MDGLSLHCAMTPTPPPNAKRTSQAREPTTQLPLMRVKRIIKVDKDIQKCGNEAATLITRATVFYLIPPQNLIDIRKYSYNI